ncbi:MAG: hypothetical protein JO041_13795 [Acidobacteria bacterium]|nr:hypothetical protein [Acidobacteriota bacterium]
MRARTSPTSLTVAVLVAFAAVALAQLTREKPAGQAANQTNRPAAQAAGDNPNTPTATGLRVRGCLVRGKQGYMLQQEATDALFDLQGDATQFAANSGRLVEAQGRELEPTADNGNPRFRVTSLKLLAGACPVTPKVPAGTANSGSTANPEPDATPRYQPANPNQRPPSVPINPNIQGTTGAPSAGSGNPGKPPGVRQREAV